MQVRRAGHAVCERRGQRRHSGAGAACSRPCARPPGRAQACCKGGRCCARVHEHGQVRGAHSGSAAAATGSCAVGCVQPSGGAEAHGIGGRFGAASRHGQSERQCVHGGGRPQHVWQRRRLLCQLPGHGKANAGVFGLNGRPQCVWRSGGCCVRMPETGHAALGCGGWQECVVGDIISFGNGRCCCR